MPRSPKKFPSTYFFDLLKNYYELILFGSFPKKFQKVHPKYKTPSFATLVTGVIVGIGALFIESDLVTDLTSIGTLFAFVLVSGGVLFLPPKEKEPGKFNLPYLNGKWLIPLLFIGFVYIFRERTVRAFTEFNWDNTEEVLFIIFLIFAAATSVVTFLRNYSTIPIMGVLTCSYLMVEIPLVSWKWFLVWMILGLVIYFLYGYRNSGLAKAEITES